MPKETLAGLCLPFSVVRSVVNGVFALLVFALFLFVCPAFTFNICFRGEQRHLTLHTLHLYSTQQ